MIDGALVLPDVRAGMIEASADGQARDPVHAQPVVDDRERVAAHSARPDRMIGRLGRARDEVEQFLVRTQARIRRKLGRHRGPEIYPNRTSRFHNRYFAVDHCRGQPNMRSPASM
jgi:hypothetical protein